ncbi:UNKNOWN [Stylonychia lemnae]|uniref:Uncharacterized protein n=1 Tax=Stylonychia lemnae TaxID=5949 RepID=A0A078A5G6_STYLE|nr:UNKNOWN [Stylonychia lemnae]|eukprot:CDW77414.1 UNKNOWN [Stylonychia lemnae]
MMSEILKQKPISKSSRNMRELSDFMERELPNIIKKDTEMNNKLLAKNMKKDQPEVITEKELKKFTEKSMNYREPFQEFKQKVFQQKFSGFDNYSKKVNASEFYQSLIQQQASLTTRSTTVELKKKKSPIKKSAVMDQVSREYRDHILSPKIKVPPLGHYNPDNKLIKSNSAAHLRFQDPNQKNSNRELFGLKLDTKIDDISNINKTFMSHNDKQNTTFYNNNNDADNKTFGQSIIEEMDKSKEDQADSSQSLNNTKVNKSRCANYLNYNQLNVTKSTMNQTGYVQFGLRPEREPNLLKKDNNFGKYIDRQKFFPEIYSKYKKLVVDLDLNKGSNRKELWKTSAFDYAQALDPKYTLVKQQSQKCIINKNPKSAKDFYFKSGLQTDRSMPKFDITKIIPPIVDERDRSYIDQENSKMLTELIKARYKVQNIQATDN